MAQGSRCALPLLLLCRRPHAVGHAQLASQAKAVELSRHNASRGFSSIKLLPGSADELVAVKTEEAGQSVASYLTVARRLRSGLASPLPPLTVARRPRVSIYCIPT